jgi:hypothetical protein
MVGPPEHTTHRLLGPGPTTLHIRVARQRMTSGNVEKCLGVLHPKLRKIPQKLCKSKGD